MTSMEEPWTDWLCDMESEDYSFINQPESNMDKAISQSQHGIATTPLDTFNNTCSTMSSNSSVAESGLEIRPSKLLKTSNSSSRSSPSPCSYILSFDNTNPPQLNVEPPMKKKTKVTNHGVVLPLNHPTNSEPRRATQESKKNSSFARSSRHTPDHIIAERMRREKISKQFIALSALIPDLKKMDKASVLGDAIKYMKELKEQVKVMEEEQSKRKSVETVAVVEKSQLSAAAEEEGVSDASSNSFNGNSNDLSLPEVEARVSEKNVLIRILCEKEKAVMANVLGEIEKLHLSVIHCSSFSFGSSFLVITAIAEMEDEFSMSVKKLAKSLRVRLMQFM